MNQMLEEDCSVFTDILSVYICILAVQIYFLKLNFVKIRLKVIQAYIFLIQGPTMIHRSSFNSQVYWDKSRFFNLKFFKLLFFIIFLFVYFRYYLKHTVLEHAFDQLCEAGFRFENIEYLNLIFVFEKILKSLWFI